MHALKHNLSTFEHCTNSRIPFQTVMALFFHFLFLYVVPNKYKEQF